MFARVGGEGEESDYQGGSGREFWGGNGTVL